MVLEAFVLLWLSAIVLCYGTLWLIGPSDQQHGRFDAVPDPARWDATLAKMPELWGCVLDADQRTGFTELIELHAGLRLDTTVYKCDFDTDSLILRPGRYDFVLSFEVLEHLYNPLWYLSQLFVALAPEGRLVLTTPKPVVGTLRHPTHFHEMTKQELTMLLEQAGFRIDQLDVVQKPLLGWIKSHRGVLRPTLRWLAGGYWYVEATK